MALWVYKSGASSTLGSTYTSGDTTLTVATGEGSKFASPTAGQFFFVRISNPSGAYAIRKCTGRSGDVLTLSGAATSNTTDANGTVGWAVDEVVTAEAIDQLKADAAAGASSPLTTKGDLFTYDTAATRLGVGADGYVLTADSSQAKGMRWAASAGGGITTPDTPPGSAGSLDDEFNSGSFDTGRWTWGNQGSATATVANGYLKLYDPAHAGDAKKYIYQATPGTPWEVTAKVCTVGKMANYIVGGVVISDATGKLIVFNSGYDATPDTYMLAVTRYNSVSSFNGYAQDWPQPAGVPIYMRIKDDGTNLTYSYSRDGAHFFQFLQQSRTTFLASGPTRVGLVVDANSCGSDAMLTCDWFRRTL